MPAVENKKNIKCVVVGDGAVGKTCLLISYAQGSFPSDYVPTVFDNYAVEVPVQNQMATLNLFDTAGQEDYDRLRPLSYTNASVFILCFSVSSKSSLENVEERWIPELRKYAPNVPFVLVGTQADKRNSSAGNSQFVGQKEGMAVAKRLGAAQYVECSARTREGLRDVFVAAIMTALNQGGSGGKKKKGCIIA